MKINPIISQMHFQGGLKKNIRRGESVLFEFKSEYPYIKSNTFWQARLDNMKCKKGANYTKQQYIIYEYADEIRDLRGFCSHIGKEMSQLRKILTKENYGNCGEILDIISEKLDEAGIEHKNLGFKIIKGRSMGNNHVFAVIGMDKNASIKDPSTWGNKAVIIDGWMNFVLSVPRAIEEYEKFFGATHRKSPSYSDFVFEEQERK